MSSPSPPSQRCAPAADKGDEHLIERVAATLRDSFGFELSECEILEIASFGVALFADAPVKNYVPILARRAASVEAERRITSRGSALAARPQLTRVGGRG